MSMESPFLNGFSGWRQAWFTRLCQRRHPNLTRHSGAIQVDFSLRS
jgi:hypothetical protein